jgi:uncharacterized membrane protein YkgB
VKHLTDTRFWNALDVKIAGWMQRHGVGLLRITLGLVFIWFGALKSLANTSSKIWC